MSRKSTSSEHVKLCPLSPCRTAIALRTANGTTWWIIVNAMELPLSPGSHWEQARLPAKCLTESPRHTVRALRRYRWPGFCIGIPLCRPSQGLPRSNISSTMLRGLPCAWLMKTIKHFPGFPRWPHRGERVLTSSHFCRSFPRLRQWSLVSSAPSSRMPTDCRRSDLGFRPAGRVGFVQEPEVHCPAQPLTPMKKAGFHSANRGALNLSGFFDRPLFNFAEHHRLSNCRT